MPKLPDPLGLQTPRSPRPVVGYRSQVGDALADAGRSGMKVAGNIQADQQQKQDKLDLTYAQADLLKRKLKAEREATADDDYTQYGTRFETLMGESVPESAKLIRNPALREQFSADSAVHIAQGLSGIQTQAEAKAKDVTLARAMEQGESLTKAFQEAKDPETRRQIAATYGSMIDASAHAIGSANAAKLKKDFEHTNAKLAWASRPDEEKLKILDSAPLSVRNNNPGNMRGKDGQFLKFATPEEGMKAMADDLRVKVTGKSKAMAANFGKGYTPTIETVVKTWAPATENDTGSYIQTVAKETGLSPTQPLTEADIPKIQSAMIKVEGSQTAASYFATNSEFDSLSPEDRAAWLDGSQRRKLAENVASNDLARDPTGFIQQLDGGKYDKYLGEQDKLKLKQAATKVFEGQQEQARMARIAEAAAKNKDIYDTFLAGGPNVLDDIAAYRTSGGDPELADYMRDATLKANPISTEEQNRVYSELFDEVTQLELKTKDGKIKIGKDDVELADLLRLQQRVMKESARGVSGLKPLLNKLSPAVLQLSGKELGDDDIGLFDGTEAYDTGYQVIQDFLEKQGKESDFALKADLLSRFVEAADAIPKGDKKAYEAELAAAANRVVASGAKKGMPNIPLPAIQKLRENPGMAAQFDEVFGVGAASRVLGR